VKLLETAAEIVGGEEALASRLGISERLLARFMADRRELPDSLLLQAVDIVLIDGQAQLASTGEVALQWVQGSRRGR
jgi:hypothetical protein